VKSAGIRPFLTVSVDVDADDLHLQKLDISTLTRSFSDVDEIHLQRNEKVGVDEIHLSTSIFASVFTQFQKVKREAPTIDTTSAFSTSSEKETSKMLVSLITWTLDNGVATESIYLIPMHNRLPTFIVVAT
jgi:hypothetical protein